MAGEATTCCLVGCGPAGAMLGFLLARAGVQVIVLEKHEDFFRDFRGDTIHPSTLQVIDELGLGERFAEVPQQRVSKLAAQTDQGMVTMADFASLNIAHQHIAFVPQWDFLDFITDAASNLTAFDLRMGAEAYDVIESGGRITGVRYRDDRGDDHEIAATLTVATDGRGSVVRRRAGLTPKSFGAPMDVLWFRMSHDHADEGESFGRFSPGHIVAMIDRGDYWQVGYVIPKGSDAELRRQGIEVLRSKFAELMPGFTERAQREPASWDDVKTLEVQVNRLKRWHRPGLLCIGDAAHAMSPVAGVGINLAVQDAVATANALAEPLRNGTLTDRNLAAIRRRRWFPTVVTQTLQRIVQKRVLEPALRGGGRAGPPRLLRWVAGRSLVRKVPARLIGVGVLPEHVRSPAVAAPAGAGAPITR